VAGFENLPVRETGWRPDYDQACLEVLKFLQTTIEHDRPTVSAAAEATSMNLRTLQRLLANGGTTFKHLLDEYRLQAAIGYLRRGDLSITDIAFKLGYSDSAHFTRAFRRWTGINPRDFRQTAA
jgi:AraC-like DNA-binding protein